ncbi:TfoX/Sxy family protein [Aureimonas mangrovi]|uniref:TfoX/Sxy family protein n=1 Tax=Aureimonas mangrovi TaxID=2758041 RepID=UPI001FE50FA6|nr:TfoX/Sxy family protein [Aureimonas mangrovi]
MMDEEHLRDLFASLSDVRIRRMFGGQGIYSGETIVALVIRDRLYLKTDEATQPFFENEGCERWTYAREGKGAVAMPYHAAPESVFDDPDDMALWAERALQAGLAARKTPRRSSARRSRK